MNSSPILQKAKRLHRAYERRMKPPGSGYPHTTWGELTGDEQAEFLELATIIHSNLDMRESDLAVLLCNHYEVHPGCDNVVYFVRRIREAKGPFND